MDWLDDTRVKKIPADAVTIDGRELAARLKDTSGGNANKYLHKEQANACSFLSHGTKKPMRMSSAAFCNLRCFSSSASGRRGSRPISRCRSCSAGDIHR